MVGPGILEDGGGGVVHLYGHLIFWQNREWTETQAWALTY